MNARLERFVRAGQFSGAVLIAKGGQVLLRQGYGLADLEQRRPFTPETPARVASVSKMFTAMAVLKLRDAGRLRLSDPICLHLKACPKTWQAITVSHLVHHTSGMVDYEEKLGLHSDAYLNFMTKASATKQVLQRARKIPLEFVPGTRFKYCNTAYVVLSLIVQEVSGRAFNDFLRQGLLEPAGMGDSGMFSARTAPNGLAVAYTRRDGLRQRIPRLALEPPAGDAALVSTVDDLYRWSVWLDHDPQAREIFTPGLHGYGLGWFIDRRFGHLRYIHTGELPGSRTVFLKYPRQGITLVIISNFDQAPLEVITRELSKMALGL